MPGPETTTPEALAKTAVKPMTRNGGTPGTDMPWHNCMHWVG
jgi:hypothetical protein